MQGWADANGLALLLRQQQPSHRLEPILETAGDQAEHTGQLDVHRDGSVKDGDDTGDGLTYRRDAEDETVAFPPFAAVATSATGQQVGDFPKAGLDAAARLSAAELVRDAHGDRCRHVPEVAAKRSTVQAASEGTFGAGPIRTRSVSSAIGLSANRVPAPRRSPARGSWKRSGMPNVAARCCRPFARQDA